MRLVLVSLEVNKIRIFRSVIINNEERRNQPVPQGAKIQEYPRRYM